jgi:hypothetical protein
MTTELRFDVAISCTEEDSWIARDLHNLVRRSGFSVYCYLEQPDVIRGFMRPKLRDIYSDSSLNVLLWSHSYGTRPRGSIPAMERRAIAARHVDRGDADSLLIIAQARRNARLREAVAGAGPATRRLLVRLEEG